jgi:glycosyltransferase involved in cell wall biosynthesis
MCDYMLGNSLAVTEELVRIDGVPADHTTTIYNGVDTARFKPGHRRLRQGYGWSDDDVVFGIVANFIPYKRHLDFVRAAARISAQTPQARFVMAGEDRGALSEVRREISQAGLDSRFVIIPGTREPERLYPAMDAYICTSETEGFSNVLLEAAASGLPLIATRVGGNPEIVFPWENGLLVPAAAPEDVAQAALTLARDPNVRRRMGRRSRELVEQRFSLETMVRQHELFYERAIEARCSRVADHA